MARWTNCSRRFRFSRRTSRELFNKSRRFARLVHSVSIVNGVSRRAALADAAERRSFDLVQDLIGKRIDVNVAQADGMTALHWAVFHDEYSAAKRLIEAGADVEACNRYGVMPLSIACQNGSEQMVKLLLSAGANANASLPGDESVLMTASRTGKAAVVEMLIEAGANVNAIEHKGQTALMWSAAEGHLDVVDLLVKKGADFNKQLDSGFTALFFAVRQGHTPVVLRLIAAGCDVNEVMKTQQNTRFNNGKLHLTPLLLAIENGHFELAKVLLDAGADPNAKPSGFTALHALTWVRKPIRGDGDPSPEGSGKYSSLDMVQMLVDAGADVNAKLERGKSELGRFTYTGSTAFLLAAQAADLPLMKLLVALGADVTVPNADRSTPLLAACGVGALGDGDESAGTEAEMIAAVEYLLDCGSDINAVDNNGETVMHGAAYQSCAKLAELLVERGADMNVWNHENRAGWTPYLIAVGYRPGNFRPSPETIDVIALAMKSANVELPDTSGRGEHLRSWSASSNAKTRWIIKDLEYAQVESRRLLLDLHFPLKVDQSKLIVWIHGGAWRSGSKDEMPLSALIDEGYTVASVDYRLSTEAKFPAQVHDIKAAIRYLRKIASRYGFSTRRIAIAGASAGGHLAALVGMSNGVEVLEGRVGEQLDQSSDVHASSTFMDRQTSKRSCRNLRHTD